MAEMNEAQENYCQPLFGSSSNSYSVGQVTGTTDEENGLKIEIPHSEPPNSSISDTADISKNDEKHNFNLSNTEHEEQAKRRTSKIADCKLHLNSPSGCKSRSHSRGRSRKRSRSPSVSSCSSSRSRSRSYTRSRSSSRSASRSRHYSRYRRSSRSSSRSHSRSLGPRYRSHPSSSYRRYHRSPRSYHRSPKSYRSRSRSRSHVRVYNGRYRTQSRSRSRSPGRRYYGFARRAYPASFRSWRSRSRSRSRGRSPLRLTEKDRRELLEIAKANAAKALGKSVDLPPSLKKDSWLTDTLHRSFEADSGKLSRQSPNLNDAVSTDVPHQQGANLFSIDSAVVQPVLDKEGNKLARSSTKDEAKKALGRWVPIQCQRNALNRL